MALNGEPSCPWPGPCGDGLREQKPELLAFPPELVAEQLSLMDAELFKKVVPHHCLGSVWSQRHQKGKEHVVPTVHAVISQFNHVADCVVATCLGDHSMKAADRARVVEPWIEVARECRTLRNFSSGLAILSALESHAIGCQKKTWVEVSRDSFHLFQTLSEIFSTESNSSQGSELISQGAIQGTVPWLGTFLTRFLVVDSAMQEFLDGAKVNFEKRRKEYQLVAELQQLQACCCYDRLVPDRRFGAWFEAVEQLGIRPRLLLSHEWEPPPESASESFQAQHPQKAASLGVESEFPLWGSSVVEIHLDHVLEAQDGQEAKRRDSRPRYKRHVGDHCFIRVTLAEDSGHKVQSILVTDQDRALAMILKALEEHKLAGEQPEDYQLVQIISGDGTLQIPDGANVYYVMVPSPDY
ncbi:ral guanine nucleotide dissociation stimulator-like [Dasypus novemcinctus]|uniref:ral guanine nucleotide dissociation stimulator-like n=1 Tax=Dasypus novemcinctus TaxID=9361 RepID=UPI00265EF83A|nr:ral guanine nucleotide dissociation stimulator-like [Dasypus novemcinctus]